MSDIEESVKKISPMFESPIQTMPSTQNSSPQQMQQSLIIVNEIKGKAFTFNKEILRCQKSDHEQARLKFLCTDAYCKNETKMACAECILNFHKDHKYVVLEKFVGEVSQKFTKVSQQAKNLEQEGQMEEFQRTLNEEVHKEFEEIKKQVLQSFEEFEKEYLINIQKFFESNRPRNEYKDKFSNIVQLAQSKFETMDSQAVVKVIEFFQDDKLEKSMDETEKNLLKTKQAISKKKAKYFEKFKQIVKDILIDCKNTPYRESVNPSYTPLEAANQSQIDDKKKRKLTFNDENSQVNEAPPLQQPAKQQSISDLQSYSTRSFAGETRRFSSSVHKKLKTDQVQQAASQQSSQQVLQ